MSGTNVHLLPVGAVCVVLHFEQCRPVALGTDAALALLDRLPAALVFPREDITNYRYHSQKINI